jgi:hypothetical protein
VILTAGFLTELEISMYIPTTDPKRIDRRYIWGVFGGIKKELALKYYQETYDAKMRQRLPVAKVQTLDIEPEWVDKLLAYEVAPSKVGLAIIVFILFSILIGIPKEHDHPSEFLQA